MHSPLAPCSRTFLPLALLLAAGTAANAATINVPLDFPTVGAAIAAAAPGDEVVVAPGTYFESGLVLTGKDIVLRSSGGSAVTIINGGGSRIFTIDLGTPSTLRVEGFTFTGGSAAGGGAGFIGGSSPTFRDCVFSANTTTSSGGALIVSVGNFAATAGAAAAPLFENCSFINNVSTASTGTTARGGAVSVSGAWPTFRNCTFTGNVHNRTGGAVGITSNSLFTPPGGTPPVTFENCSFSANVSTPTSATVGGGPAIHVNNRSIVMTGCTISNHTSTATVAVGAYGLVLAGTATGQSATLTNTTFSNNYHSGGTASNRPIILVVAPGATLTMNGGGLTNNGFRLSDGAELGFSTGINFSPPAGAGGTLVVSGSTFTGNSTSPTTPTGNTALIFGSGNATAGQGGIASATITNASVTGNEISAVLFASGGGSLSFAGGTISGNVGGASMIVANPVGSLSLTGTSFSGNSGLISVSGAASPATAGNFLLDAVTVNANPAGAVSATNFATANILGSRFENSTNLSVNFNGAGNHAVRGSVLRNNTYTAASSARSLGAFGDAGTGTLVVENTVFSGNVAGGSSADVISADGLASFSLLGSTLSDNAFTGVGAGVITLSEIPSVTVQDVEVLNNPARGLSLSECAGSVTNSIFENNENGIDAAATAAGALTITWCDFVGGTGSGGIPTGANIDGALSATITSSRFIGQRDGAIGLGGSGTHVVQNTLVSGVTGTNGGAVNLSGTSSTTIRNSTLTGNFTTSGSAGGVTLVDSASAVIVNTISYGNNSPEVDGSGSTGTLDVTFSNVQGGFGGLGNIDLSPSFADPDGPDNVAGTLDDNYRLNAGSAGLNAGNSAAVPGTLTTDLAGGPRIVGAFVDMGAYELGSLACNRADVTDIGDTGAGPDGQLTVDDIIAFINTFSDATGCPGAAPCNMADITDIGDTGTGPDGQLTVDDIIAFFNAFSDGC